MLKKSSLRLPIVLHRQGFGAIQVKRGCLLGLRPTSVRHFDSMFLRKMSWTLEPFVPCAQWMETRLERGAFCSYGEDCEGDCTE